MDPQRPVTYRFQNASNLALFTVAVVCGVALIFRPEQLSFLFPVMIALVRSPSACC